jgi:DNA-binding GntR family transcriptional regulator
MEYVDKTEQVDRLLRKRILEGEISPGSRLVERKLAEELEVSKTPIREALVRLGEEGLTDGEVHRGLWVAEITKEDAKEIYDLREILEGLAAREAVEKINQEQCRKLVSFLKEFEKCYRQKDLRAYSNIDIRFHDFLIEISGNKRLYELVSHLRAQSRLLMSTSVNLPGRAKASLSEHKKIVQVVVNREGKLAEQYAREHIRNVKKAVLQSSEKKTKRLSV